MDAMSRIHDMNYRITGAGPVTVFIIPGLGIASAELWPIQDALGAHARVVSWDRPGCGDSGPTRSARTSRNIAREALEVLDIVAPNGPLIVVGHSQGGFYANSIARLAGSRVRGL